MISYVRPPLFTITFNGLVIPSFIQEATKNIDINVVESFGEEWSKFNQFASDEIKRMSNEYFDVLPESLLNKNTRVLDAGCGMGRWTYALADNVAWIDAIDPSKAALAAAKLLADKKNVRVTQAEINDIPFPTESYDLTICLGVLHHMPDTESGLRALHKMLKPGGGLLLYLYYALEFRPFWFRGLFFAVNQARNIIARLPSSFKKIVCELIALSIYFPLAKLAALTKLLSNNASWTEKIPLSSYSNKSFRVMRLDALDRFGTALEKRFTKEEIEMMLKRAGFNNLRFSEQSPYWHVYATKCEG